MRLAQRVPKLKGFTNPSKRQYAIVNVGALSIFPDGASVTLTELKEKRLVRASASQVKILGTGTITKALKIETKYVSAYAQKKIEKAGGSVHLVTAKE
jgi:large subunit ribosomal protein L15